LATGVTAVQKMVVAPQKTVKLHAYILRTGLLNVPVIDSAQVTTNLNTAVERYAQCGIQITYKIDTVVSNPTGVVLSDGFDVFYLDPSTSKITVPAESQALFTALHGDSDEISIYYVSEFVAPDHMGIDANTKGISSVPKFMYSSDIASGFGNKILINSHVYDIGPNFYSEFAESHEVLHILLNAEHDDYSTSPDEIDDLTMLWHAPTDEASSSKSVSVMATKRISKRQADTAIQNPFAK